LVKYFSKKFSKTALIYFAIHIVNALVCAHLDTLMSCMIILSNVILQCQYETIISNIFCLLNTNSLSKFCYRYNFEKYQRDRKWFWKFLNHILLWQKDYV